MQRTKFCQKKTMPVIFIQIGNFLFSHTTPQHQSVIKRSTPAIKQYTANKRTCKRAWFLFFLSTRGHETFQSISTGPCEGSRFFQTSKTPTGQLIDLLTTLLIGNHSEYGRQFVVFLCWLSNVNLVVLFV